MRRRKFTRHLSQGAAGSSKPSENNVPPEDSFENFKITCVSEPIDYEQFLVRNKVSIMNDLHRDLILFPQNDATVFNLQRQLISPQGFLPPGSTLTELSSTNFLARHSISEFSATERPFVHLPLLPYRGNFYETPRDKNVKEVIGTPKPQWYAIDHLRKSNTDGSVLGAAANGTGGISVVNGGITRPWATAMSGVRRTNTRGTLGLSDATNGATSSQKSLTTACLQAQAAICDRKEYQAHMKCLEDALASKLPQQSASGPNTSPGPVGVRPRQSLCIRQLTADDLEKLQYRDSGLNSSTKAPPNLPLGLHLIVPSDWELSPNVPSSDTRNLIFFDVIESAVSIGRHWLRLDLHTQSPRQKMCPSYNLASFVTSANMGLKDHSEAYICFDEPEQRDLWLTQINAAIKAEQIRRHVGYASSKSGDSRLPDNDSLRRSLQQFSEETELIVSRQRQKDRLSILSVFPEIRLPFDEFTEEAARRLSVATDIAALCDTRNCKSKEEVLRRFLPDWREDYKPRRFLVTCLSLKTGLRASLQDGANNWKTDNPEPFFVTFFLASAIDGTRLSEEFTWNPNSALIDSMLPAELFRQLPWIQYDELQAQSGPPHVRQNAAGSLTKQPAPQPPVTVNPQGIAIGNSGPLAKCRSALLTIDPHVRASSLWLVFRVDKVLTGGIGAAIDKYLKANGKGVDAGDSPKSSDLKTGISVHKSMLSYCKVLGRYRMPFAWGAKSLFSHDFHVPLFRMDGCKVSEASLMQNVQQLSRLIQSNSLDSTHVNGYGSRGSTSDVERALKTEIIPIQLCIAVNELSFETVSHYLRGLVSPQLIPMRYSTDQCTVQAPFPTLSNVVDFTPDEPVKELASFVARKLRHSPGSVGFIVGQNGVGGGNGGTKHLHESVDHGDYGRGLRSNLLMSENKRDSIISSRSASEMGTSTGCGETSSAHFRLGGVVGALTATATLSSKAPSLERLHGSTLGVDSVTSSREAVPGSVSGTEETFFSGTQLSMVTPYRQFQHTLYVYPKSLNLSVKHNFSRARNICCFIELRDDDSADAKPLKVFYTRSSPNQPLFDTWFNTSVVHHNASPTFLEEAKLCLPLVLTPRTHLLFRFYHVRCDLASNSSSGGIEKSALKKSIEAPTGFAWLPLLHEDGSIPAGAFSLPLSSDLPSGYLAGSSATQPSVRFAVGDKSLNQAGDTPSRTEVSWIENRRPLFSVTLEPVSSLYSTNRELARFFTCCSERLIQYTRICTSSQPFTPRGVRFVNQPVVTGVGLGSTAAEPPVMPSRPASFASLMSQLDTIAGKQLTNSMKSLLMVDAHDLTQFFPSLVGQFIETMLAAVSVGQYVITATATKPTSQSITNDFHTNGQSNPSGPEGAQYFSWSALGRNTSLGSPGDLAKTAIGTLSMLLARVSNALPSDGAFINRDLQAMSKMPRILSDYIDFSFDAEKLVTDFSSVYRVSLAPSGGSGFGSQITVHHTIVRAAICLLVDYFCVPQFTQCFLQNSEFFYGLISKSLAQYLCSCKRIKMDRKDPTRISSEFSDDLTLMLRMMGKCMAQLGYSEHSDTQHVLLQSGSLRSNTSPNAYNFDSIGVSGLGVESTAGSRDGTASKNSGIGALLADSTASFLLHLLPFMDRGYVMHRLRDLLAALEIRHHMSAVEVDRFNLLRYQLLQRFCETEFFVQINLPSLSPSYRADRRDEFYLTERFRQDHFVVGLVLQQVSCLLAGCADAGGWSAASSSRVHRQPLVMLRSQLAKLAFDSRYAGAKHTQARICMLFLPLIHLILENIGALGPPGQSLRSVRNDHLKLHSPKNDSKKSKSRLRGKNVRKAVATAAASSITISSSSRPVSVTSGSSWELGDAVHVSDSSNSSLSSVSISNKSSSSTLPMNSLHAHPAGRPISSHGTVSSAESRSSAPYLTEGGKVSADVLNQIAGFNQGGRLQRVHWKRDGSAQKPENSAASLPASHQLSGSTLTLTGAEDNEKDVYWLHENIRNNADKNETGSIIEDADCNSDIDETEEVWTDRVLELAGVIPNSSFEHTPTHSANGSIGNLKASRETAPTRPPTYKPRPTGVLTNGTACTALAHGVAVESMLSAQSDYPGPLDTMFAYTFRPHIHRCLPPMFGVGVTAANSTDGGTSEGTPSFRRLPDKCQRDLYISFLHVLSSLAEEPLTTLFRDLSAQDRVNFLTLLTYVLKHLKYRGQTCISRLNTISTSSIKQRTSSLPASPLHSQKETTKDRSDYKVLLEANLATESGFIILDTLHLFTSTFRKDLELGGPSNSLFQGLINVYVCLLTTGQSEVLFKHVFASLRVFIVRFAMVLFSETTDGLASVCMAALRASNLNLLSIDEELSPTASHCLFDAESAANLNTLRLEACGLIYRMWRSSFESFAVRGFHRIHLQMIISLSKLVGNIGPEFETSLSLLHSLAELDVHCSSCVGFRADRERSRSPALVGTSGNQFLEDIKDLIKRIRAVLTATDEMRRYRDDPERLIDLQYSLAKSYASNPVLRRTWLEELANLHLSLKNMAEVAMAKLHIAAFMAEYLRKRGEFPQGCDAFSKVSANIRIEETCQLADPSILELSYNQEDLLRDVKEAAFALEAAGLYEALQPVYALITPVFEARKDYLSLSEIYHHLGRAYVAINNAETSGQRLFAAYYRVAFYGKAFETLAGKAFIYRTEACQKLSVFIQTLLTMYTARLGQNNVELLTESYVSPNSLSPNKAYIQVAFVEPFVQDTGNQSPTSFDAHHNVRQFFFETPFIMQPGMSVDDCFSAPGPKRSEDLTVQWKRRTTLTTSAAFPHLRRRLEVTSTLDTDLSPIDAATEAIQFKTRELAAHIPRAPRTKAQETMRGIHLEETASGDIRVPLLLDMQLQGALLPTVNQGPMAYAHAFLKPESAALHPPAKVQRLKKLFFDFLTTCLVLLTRYQSIMIQVHETKYRFMRQALDSYRVDLSNLLNEEVVVDEARQIVCLKSEINN